MGVLDMKTFFPNKKKSTKVDASSHGKGTHYRIAVGTEMWGNEPVPVLKIQMECDNKVAGRKVPSFPVTKQYISGVSFDICEDFDAVVNAVETIVTPLRTWLISWDRPLNGPDVTDIVVDVVKELYNLDEEDVERPCHSIRTTVIEEGRSAEEVRDEILRLMAGKGAPKGTKLFVARLSDHSSGNLA